MVPSRAKRKTICFNARLPAKAGRRYVPDPLCNPISNQGQPQLPFTVPSPRQYQYAFWLRQASAMVPPGLSRAFDAGTPVDCFNARLPALAGT